MTTTAPALTPRQAEVLAAITAYWANHGMAPSVRELAGLVGVQINAVTGHLAALARAGVIEWPRDGCSRGIWPAGMRDAVKALFGGTP